MNTNNILTKRVCTLALLTGAFSLATAAPIVVPTTTTDWNGGATDHLYDAANWSSSVLPVMSEVGLINTDGRINNSTGVTAGMQFVQTAGEVQVNSNVSFAGSWYLTNGTITGQSAGSGGMLDAASPMEFTLYALGGNVLLPGTFRSRFGGGLYVEDGTVSLGTVNMTNNGILTFGDGNGSVEVTTSINISGGDVNFLTGSGGSFKVTGYTSTNFETLWTSGVLQVDGAQTGNFGDHFTVTGDTLTLIPEPSTLVLFGLAGLALLLKRRKA